MEEEWEQKEKEKEDKWGERLSVVVEPKRNELIVLDYHTHTMYKYDYGERTTFIYKTNEMMTQTMRLCYYFITGRVMASGATRRET